MGVRVKSLGSRPREMRPSKPSGSRIRRGNDILPYAIVLAIVSYLYFLAGRIDFVAPGGRIGPNFWPKAILGLTTLTCLYEIAKNLIFAKRDGARDLEGVLGSVLKEVPQEIATEEPEG